MANTNPEPERSVSTDEPVPPLAINHVGHTVPDIDAAVEWYADVLGFSIVAPPAAIEAGSGHFADLVADIVGDFDEL